MLLDQLSAINESLLLLRAVGTLVGIFVIGAIITAAFCAQTLMIAETGRKRAWVWLVSCGMAVLPGICYLIAIQPHHNAEIETRKAEICESAFTQFIEQEDADLGRRALKAGCDRDELLVILVTKGDAQSAQAAAKLLAAVE